jgi:DNA-binding NarL/FixJ family response regulator
MWLDALVTKAVVIDEWALIRHGVRAQLEAAGVDMTEVASTATDGFAALARTRADLLVIGSCPDSSAVGAVRRARGLADLPGLKVIVLVGATSQRALVELCSAGANAVAVRSSDDPDAIATAARAVGRDERYLSSELLRALFAEPTPAAPRMVSLTSRERAVLNELAAGRSNREIASSLCIGAETVKTHLGNIYTKLAVTRRDQAISRALTGGLV